MTDYGTLPPQHQPEATSPEESSKGITISMENLLSGATFGAALTASGVYQPSVIISQLKFENFHMLQAFLTACAGSASVFPLPKPTV